MKFINLKKSVIASIGVLAWMAVGCSSSNSPEPTAPTTEWELMWEENFDGSEIDLNNWSRIPRGRSDWNNYMSSHDTLFSLSNGNLQLWGRVNDVCPNDTAPFITGGVYTRGKRTFENGKIEISAKFEDAKGAWPAFWLLPADEAQWPTGGEIDIMERLNSDRVAYQTVHSHYTVNLGIKDHPIYSVSSPIKHGEYNTYGVELATDTIKFYINGKNTLNYPRISTEHPGQFPFNRAYYLLLDMQLGGSWVGRVEPADLPVKMDIDWVRFYQRKKE